MHAAAAGAVRAAPVADDAGLQPPARGGDQDIAAGVVARGLSAGEGQPGHAGLGVIDRQQPDVAAGAGDHHVLRTRAGPLERDPLAHGERRRDRVGAVGDEDRVAVARRRQRRADRPEGGGPRGAVARVVGPRGGDMQDVAEFGRESAWLVGRQGQFGIPGQRFGEVAVPAPEDLARGRQRRDGDRGVVRVPAAVGGDRAARAGGDGAQVLHGELPVEPAFGHHVRVGHRGPRALAGQLPVIAVLLVEAPAAAGVARVAGRVGSGGRDRAGEDIAGREVVGVAVGRDGHAEDHRDARDQEGVVEPQAVVVAEERHRAVVRRIDVVGAVDAAAAADLVAEAEGRGPSRSRDGAGASAAVVEADLDGIPVGGRRREETG